jgi:hypothetical protein
VVTNLHTADPNRKQPATPFNWAVYAEAVAVDLFGKPNEALSHLPDDMRFGFKGSMRVDYTTGDWHDAESGDSGGLRDLIRIYAGIEDDEAAVAYAKECKQRLGNGGGSNGNQSPGPDQLNTAIPEAQPPQGGEALKPNGGSQQETDAVTDFLLHVVPFAESPGGGSIAIFHQYHQHLAGETPGVHFCSSIEEFLPHVSSLIQRQFNVFFCLSRQKPATGPSRNNAVAFKALCINLIVDPNDNKSLGKAVNALTKFCKYIEIKMPSALVDYGTGISCYWFSNRELSLSEWEPLAEGLKTAASDYGLKIDASVTVDAVPLLRPPGTWNYETKPRAEVRLIGGTQQSYDIAAAFGPLTKQQVPEPEQPTPAAPQQADEILKPNDGDQPLPEPDRSQIETFVLTLFKHATPGNWVSLRAFFEGRADLPPCNITPVRLNGDLNVLTDQAFQDAKLAASYCKKVVFCPPIATFITPKNAKEISLAEGLVLNAECDAHAQAARVKLEQLLGPATVVVESGGEWINPETNEPEPKLHLH